MKDLRSFNILDHVSHHFVFDFAKQIIFKVLNIFLHFQRNLCLANSKLFSSFGTLKIYFNKFSYFSNTFALGKIRELTKGVYKTIDKFTKN
jgi:small-conductance mechanosensitive channel